MVSDTLGMTLDELVVRLNRMAGEHADDPDYRELRSALPDDFPF